MRLKLYLLFLIAAFLGLSAAILHAYHEDDSRYLQELSVGLKPLSDLQQKFEALCQQNYEEFLSQQHTGKDKKTSSLWHDALVNPSDAFQITEASPLIKQVTLEPIADAVALVHARLNKSSRPLFAEQSWLGWLHIQITPISENARVSFRMACDRKRFMFLLHRIDFDPQWLPSQFMVENE